MIPIINFESCSIQIMDQNLTSNNALKVGNEICSAFKSTGFVYLKNHGIFDEQVQKVYDVTKRFFNLDTDVKNHYAHSVENLFGYGGYEGEKLNTESTTDPKESFNVIPKLASDCKWPKKELPEFENIMCDMYNACMRLSLRVLHLIGLGLNLQDPYFFVKEHSYINEASYTSLRSLYYPSLSVTTERQIRCGEHSDYGSITLLFQDQVGGLEVMNVGGEYMKAPPIPGTVVVNIGDLMQRWTSDTLQSAKHRVVIPDTDDKKREARQSLAFFVIPDDAAVIRCIDGSDKYQPIKASDYLEMKVAPTMNNT